MKFWLVIVLINTGGYKYLPALSVHMGQNSACTAAIKSKDAEVQIVEFDMLVYRRYFGGVGMGSAEKVDTMVCDTVTMTLKPTLKIIDGSVTTAKIK